MKTSSVIIHMKGIACKQALLGMGSREGKGLSPLSPPYSPIPERACSQAMQGIEQYMYFPLVSTDAGYMYLVDHNDLFIFGHSSKRKLAQFCVAFRQLLWVRVRKHLLQLVIPINQPTTLL